MVTFPKVQVAWPKTHRLVNAQYPPIDVYDDLTGPHDWARLTLAVQKSNPRLNPSLGDPTLIPEDKVLYGKGAAEVMAAFVHVSVARPSRFTDGSYGVYYAGDTIATALHEHCFHMGRFYARTAEAPGWNTTTRELVGSIDAVLTDLRGPEAAALLDPDPDKYGASQDFAKADRADGSNGVIYPSVRLPGSGCIGAFWPNVVSPAVQGDHFQYHWNGERVDFVRELTGRQRTFELSL